MAGGKSEPTFEVALQGLEALVTRLEKGELTLSASVQAFEEGVKLHQVCARLLEKAAKQVQVLVEKQGQATLEPMDSDEPEGD